MEILPAEGFNTALSTPMTPEEFQKY